MQAATKTTPNNSVINIRIGVLALQGAFIEHYHTLARLSSSRDLDWSASSFNSTATATTTPPTPTPDGGNSSSSSNSISITPCLVKNEHDLLPLHALIIPGGESTTLATLAHGALWEALKVCICRIGLPVWGTCAGLILLAESIVPPPLPLTTTLSETTTATINYPSSPYTNHAERNPSFRKPDPPTLRALPITVSRNAFGSQVNSFEQTTPFDFTPFRNATKKRNDADTESGGSEAKEIITPHVAPFPGVFIRAPVIVQASPDVTVLAKATMPPRRQTCHNQIKSANQEQGSTGNQAGKDEVIVAARWRHVLVTAFHPELTGDDRLHRFFIEDFVLPSLYGGLNAVDH